MKCELLISNHASIIGIEDYIKALKGIFRKNNILFNVVNNVSEDVDLLFVIEEFVTPSRRFFEILKNCKNKPVSLEVFGDNYGEMKKQALTLNNLGKNVYVKIPVCNSKGDFSGKIINFLSNNKVKLNITAVYTASQTKNILKVIKVKQYGRSKIIFGSFK